jgi:hypothetical protein
MLPMVYLILLSNMVCIILSASLESSLASIIYSHIHSTSTAANSFPAPLVYLHPQDKYGPSDLNGQITNTTPREEFKGLTSGVPSPLTLENLDQLNALGKNGSDIYLTSNDDITKNPTWMLGVKPDAGGKTDGATSCAIIVANKGGGMVDVFYMYFYAYNWGGVVGLINKNLGNHVGDW